MLLKVGNPKEQGLDEDGDSVNLDCSGGRALEVIENELVPLVSAGLGEVGLEGLFALGADHHGEGFVDHVVAKAHAGDGVVLEVGEWGGAGGAFPGPFAMVFILGQSFGALGKVGAVIKEGGHGLARFLG